MWEGATSQGMQVAFEVENDPWLIASKETGTSVLQQQRSEFGNNLNEPGIQCSPREIERKEKNGAPLTS